jgi:hypothetical protein
MGFRRDTSAIGAVEYDFMQRVCEFPNPNIPVDVCKKKKNKQSHINRILQYEP